jgi:membrane-associated protease RseP (regulator of RpoE activity)
LGYSQEQIPGTTGISVVQVYNSQRADRLGVYIVRRVADGSAAADVGIRPGDLIIKANGSPTEGSDIGSFVRTVLTGPAGITVSLSVVGVDGKPKDVTLMRRPYSPHLNPASDPFHYSVPGNWRLDPRFPFPLPWAPTITYKVFDDLAFAPGFDDVASPEYYSYLFVWWIEGGIPNSVHLNADMIAYFQGLSKQRGERLGFRPDASKITASFHEGGQTTLGSQPASFWSGNVTVYDTHGQVVALSSEISATACPNSGHSLLYFAMSKEPRPAALWNQLDAVKRTIQCGGNQ